MPNEAQGAIDVPRVRDKAARLLLISVKLNTDIEVLYA